MKRRVLVRDDHFPSRTFLIQTLVRRGFEVVGEAISGNEGMRLAQRAVVDVVFMAVGLPDRDGVSVAAEIMQRRPLPITGLTSHYDADTIARAMIAGVMGYLIKPVREQELSPAIELAIARFAEFNSLRKDNKNLLKALEARKVIEKAKGVLMAREGLSEAEAFSRIRKKSMERRQPMVEVANAIILAEELTTGRSPK